MSKYNFPVFYGGTFDPIHYGHIYPVIALAHILKIDRVILLPSSIPLHRSKPKATFQQRLEMIQLALVDIVNDLFVIDERELSENCCLRTVETFQKLHDKYGSKTPLGFILGEDSLLKLPEWYRWYELFNLCHILVCARPNYTFQLVWKNIQWIRNRLTNDLNVLRQKPSGFIYYASTHKVAISSSEIRERYRNGFSCRNLVPPKVEDYIKKYRIYQ